MLSGVDDEECPKERTEACAVGLGFLTASALLRFVHHFLDFSRVPDTVVGAAHVMGEGVWIT